MTAVQTYMKAIHSLAALLDDPTLPVKDSPLLRTSKDLLDFSAALRSTDSLRRIFRIIMDNLISASTKNAVFFAEKLYTLMDKSPIATYLLGTILLTQASASSRTLTTSRCTSSSRRTTSSTRTTTSSCSRPGLSSRTASTRSARASSANSSTGRVGSKCRRTRSCGQ